MARWQMTHQWMLQTFLVILSMLLVARNENAMVEASIYPVESQMWIPPFQHAEKMFASDKGPILARDGNSTITIDVSGVNLTNTVNGWRLVVFVYHVNNYDAFIAVEDQIELLACSQETGLEFEGMSEVQKYSFVVANASVHANAVYHVDVAGWIDTQIYVCPNGEAMPEDLQFAGTMEVRNPYGLLPAVLYGMLPFSGLLTIGYLILDGFFAVLLCRHRQQVIQLHYGILLVLVISTVATSIWFYAFYNMNKTGEPVCCPYPTIFLAAVVLDAVVRTLARIILLVVCLGYGIVRSRLSGAEIVVITLLSLAYFVSGVADEITRGTSSGSEFRQQPTAWSFLQLLCNLVFIMWIHYSLERILKQLREQKQFAKLGMYKSLAWALVAFIIFFSILTIVAVCGRLGVFEWDVELEWMQLVAWPVLNFTVSTSMCFIWRPTQNSSQFAFSMQLPMTDDGQGLEMTTHDSSSDDDIDVELESDEEADGESSQKRKEDVKAKQRSVSEEIDEV